MVLSKESEIERLLIPIIGGIACCISQPIFAESTFCPMPVRAKLQKADGTATLGKVGFKCSLVCPPIYYTVQEGEVVDKTLVFQTVAPPGSSCASSTKTVKLRTIGATTIINKYLTPSDTPRQGCGNSNYKTTSTINSGSASITGSPTPSENCATTKTAGTWLNQACVDSVESTFSLAFEQWLNLVGAYSCENTVTCTFSGDHCAGVYSSAGSAPCADVTNTRTYTSDSGTVYSSEFTTSELKSELNSRAANSISSSFIDGNPKSVRSLNGDEDCGTATDAKYRILIINHVPGTYYTITYKVTARHRDGSASVVTRRMKQKAPSDQDWYFPNAAGAKIPTPQWPPGACTQGGVESITYSDVTIEEK